ncbi:8-amino-7-oxononanoate synthase [Gordonia soli]|uniref:8-amino-7-oxononanoate synthase n=1 Tax=Gordonia soli TaxID=320799 RepID=UPI00058E312F
MVSAEAPRHSNTGEDRALAWLTADAAIREERGVHRDPLIRRTTGSVGAAGINLASNDYLGLSTDARVVAGARDALERWGAGATASRLVVGTTELHIDFEQQLADFMGFPAALLFSSGYLANVGAITALVGRGDLIVSDSGAHASLIDGCRLSRARVVVVDRGDHEAIRTILRDRTEERALVVTDAVYSIDGRLAPIAEFYAATRDHGAALIVDEAHGLGVRGPGGRGLVAEAGLAGAPDLIVTTVCSKSLGSQGGVVLGSHVVRSHLIDRARSFIFDTGLAPAAVGGARAALAVLQGDPTLPRRLHANAARLADRCGAPEPESAVISLVVGDPHAAVAAAARCRQQGVLVGCFRPPSVPIGTSRLRLTVRADLDPATLDHVAEIVCAALESQGVR